MGHAQCLKLYMYAVVYVCVDIITIQSCIYTYKYRCIYIHMCVQFNVYDNSFFLSPFQNLSSEKNLPKAKQSLYGRAIF